MGDQCQSVQDGQRCRLPAFHDASMNATPHDYGPCPPQRIVEIAVLESTVSPCRSKRGAALFVSAVNGMALNVGSGHNRKPIGFVCDGSAECKATCRQEAVHAEQHALIEAGRRAAGAEIVHVKTVDGELVASEPPSCIQCSKLLLAAGVSGFWLFQHAVGWRYYPMADYHRLSLAHPRNQPPAPQVSPVASEPDLQAFQKADLERVLASVGGNKLAAAKALGISRRALYRRLERLDLHVPTPRSR